MPKKRTMKKVNIPKKEKVANKEAVVFLLDSAKRELELLERQKELKQEYLYLISEPHALDTINTHWSFELSRAYKQHFIHEVELDFERFMLDYEAKKRQLNNQILQLTQILKGEKHGND